MTTRDIRSSTAHTTCDMCGRTLLRGERAEIYVSGGTRRSVCELCTARAQAEGWVREGTVPPYTGGEGSSDRRRSLLGRLRRRRGSKPAPEYPPAVDGLAEWEAWTEPSRSRQPAREPRHVRAVPTSVQQKIASAIDVFNSSEHPRTVSGVARSLGPPTVSVRPASVHPSLVNLVVSWELCWYRYEIDLADEEQSVRVAAQGAELEELDPGELQPNAVSDEQGSLVPSA